jgi:hypothetical protein
MFTEDSKPTLVAHERRQAVSEWLQEVISEEEEDEEVDTRTHNIEKVVKHLTKGDLLDSVQCSQEMGKTMSIIQFSSLMAFALSKNYFIASVFQI